MPPKKNLMNTLDSKIIDFYCNKYNLDSLTVIKYVDLYVNKQALKKNVSYNIIFNQLNNNILYNTLPDIYEHKNKLMIIKDVDLINEDPDKYIKQYLGNTEELKKLVKTAAYLYHNYDGSGLTDNSYDALEYHLQKRYKIKNRMYEKIGAAPIDKIRKQLLYPMPSLFKIKPGESKFQKFISNILSTNNECMWSLKLDGVSCMAIYKRGKLFELNTRGKGNIGGDITNLADSIPSIPKHIKNTKAVFVVRGELIFSKKIWDEKYKGGDYCNARGFVSAKVNSGFISPVLNDIQYVTYEIMTTGDVNVPKPSDMLIQLKKLGFIIVDSGIFKELTSFNVINMYITQRNISIYNIDGLVLTINEEREAVTLLKTDTIVKSPIHTVAFKMMLEEQIRETKVINIDWRISRRGIYVPVAIYNSVYIDGTRLHRASAFNANHIKKWSMGNGTNIKIIRSGDVIPFIKDENVIVDNTITPIYPSNEYNWKWNNINIVLEDIDNNPIVQIKRIIFFFKTIGLTKIGEKTIEKMHAHGMTTPESIIKSTVTELMKIKGIGKKKAESYYNDIRKILQNITPDRLFIASSTYTNNFISRPLLKLLLKKIPNILDLNTLQIKDYFKHNKIPGFGPAKINTVAINIPDIRSYLDNFAKDDLKISMSNYINKIKILDTQGRNKKIENKNFVLTGFMNNINYDFEDYMYDHHSNIIDKVSKDVTAIINGNTQDMSKKMLMGAELNIPIYTLEEFITIYNIPLKINKNKDNDIFTD